MTTTADRCRVFHQLHQSGCFVMPNPWDLGSARLLAQLGFPALATTSAGLAWSLGRPDNQVPLEQVLAHLRSIAQSVEVPVNADFEGGFATAPEAVGANVAAAATTGVAGFRSKIRPATPPSRFLISRSRSSASGRPAKRSMPAG